MDAWFALTWILFIVFGQEETILHHMVRNYRTMSEAIMDVALPVVLLASLVLGVYAIIFKSNLRRLERWFAILNLCLIYELIAQNQSVFHPCDYSVLIRKAIANLLQLVDIAMPTILLVLIIKVSHFLIYSPIQWPLIRWAAAFALCIIFVVRAKIQHRWPKQEDGDAGGQTALSKII